MFWIFLLYMLLFAVPLYFSMMLGAAGMALVGGAAVLALLWMLIEKLDSVEKKLDELLKKRDEHDNQ